MLAGVGRIHYIKSSSLLVPAPYTAHFTWIKYERLDFHGTLDELIRAPEKSKKLTHKQITATQDL
jgi:hypothetical protein